MQVEEITKKLDELFATNKGPEAQKLLEASIKQAMEEEDDGALLTLLNEMIGYMRETSQVESSYSYADAAIKLMERMGIAGSTAYATTLLNIANAYRAGGRLKDSLSCYQEVLALYQQKVDPKDMLFASLYNNISLLYQEMGEFGKAKENLLQALAIVKESDDSYFEEAVTYANLAATCLNLNEDDTAAEYFKRSIEIFERYGIRDAHYCAALSSMGTYYYKKQEYEKAAECFEKAMAGMKESLGENEYYQRLSENLAACRRAAGLKEAAQADRSCEETVHADTKRADETAASGMELCRAYYETYGKTMIQEQFAEYEDRIAVGLCGEGSDCFGYDDAVSRDHDWGPGFCMWVSDEVYAQIGEKLQEAYNRLPSEFHGFVRRESRQGQGRVGVCTITGFYERLLGKGNCPNPNWSEIPDEALAAAVNGEVFTDKEGTFSAIRNVLKKGFPERMWYLKIAEGCARFSQAAQYNFGRMAGRGDSVAAELSLAEGVRWAMKLVYYMEREYPPHDKWLYRGIAGRDGFEKEADLLKQIMGKGETAKRIQLVEELAEALCDRLYAKDIISDRESYLDAHTGELLRKAALAELTDEALVERIAKTEFDAFDKVRNTGGRASCQNDWYTFEIMRKSQYMTWNRKMLLQYLYDFETEYARGRNLIEEKYGRMMESTVPEEYAAIADNFPAISPEKKQIIEAIVQIQVGFMEEFAEKYPHLAGNARTIHTYEDQPYDTSYETYLRGEISTYSDKMLELYGRFIAAICKEGKNLAVLTMENSVHLYGYQTLEDAENAAG
ncbi:MAG: DUF4125 family protein [Lachnospiraceae bacterium]